MSKLLGQVSEGTIVKLNESGVPVEFYVAKQDYESGLNGSGRVLLVRKDCYDTRQWNSSNENQWATCSLHLFLNESYKSVLDPWVQEAIGTTTYYYTYGNGAWGVSTRSDAVFQLSLTELGKSNTYANVEGVSLPIAGTLLIAYRDGAPVTQWTRSPSTDDTGYSWRISTSGSVGQGSCASSYGSRPCFTLPSTVLVLDDGTVVQSLPAPSNFTYPVAVMQGISIPLSWSAVDGADTYIVQRKVDSGEWTQVYSGSATTFTDTAGSWSTVQYQVCGVFDGTNGAFSTSTTITILSASALVISGEDEDLGTITADVTYSVATDTGNPISLTRYVNGIQIAALTVESGFSYSIPVIELPAGSGTIVITATVQSSSGPVTQTRTWTYTKTPVTFPDAGAVGVLAQGGQNVLPVTAAEAVRVSPAWGGSLDKALDFIRGPGSIVQSYPIASGQTVAAGQVVDVTSVQPTVGQYVAGNIQVQNIPVGSLITRTENGIPQYYLVVHQGLPSEMYDASCSGTWVLRLNIYENAAWDAGNSNVLPGADIFTTMAGMLSLFDAETQAAIKTVKIPYCVGGGQSTVQSGANGLQCQIFPLGGYEVGYTSSDNAQIPQDGARLSFFGSSNSGNNGRIATLSNESAYWYLRSPYTNTSSSVWGISLVGSRSGSAPNSEKGIRPAFILDPTLEVDGYYESGVEAITTTGTPSQAIALQGGSADDTIPVIFQGVAQLSGVTQGQQITSSGVQGYGALDGWLSVFPYWLSGAKIATGSYTGTGSYGERNPNTLTLPFVPEIVIISGVDYFNPGNGCWSNGVIWVKGAHKISIQSSGGYNFFSLDGKKLSWYTSYGTPDSQLNIKDYLYNYVAIG